METEQVTGDKKLFPLPENWSVGYMSDDGKVWHGQSREQEDRLDKLGEHLKKRKLTEQQMAEEIQRILGSSSDDSDSGKIFLYHITSGSIGHFIRHNDRYNAKIPLYHIEPPSGDYEFDGIADMVRKGWLWERSPWACGRPDWIEKDGFYYPAE